MKDKQINRSTNLLKSLLEDIESENLEKKNNLNIKEIEHKLRLVKTIVSMANTKGGNVLIKPFEKTTAQEYDSAKIDDLVNKYIEPRIQGITSDIVKDYVIISIPNSTSKPHIFKKDGQYANQRKEFYKGTILVRHSSKVEIINHDDISRIIDEKIDTVRKSWLEGVRKISMASPSDEILVVSKNKVSTPESVLIEAKLTDDTNAPIHLPVRRIQDTSKYETAEDELIGCVKIWKTDKESFMRPSQLGRAYANQEKIKLDNERLEFLIRSAFHSRMAACYWCSEFNKEKLKSLLTEVIQGDEFPSIVEALKIILILGDNFAKKLFNYTIKNSHSIIAKTHAQSFLKIVESKEEGLKFIINKYKYLKYQNKKLKEILKDEPNARRVTMELAQQIGKGYEDSSDKNLLKMIDLALYSKKLKQQEVKESIKEKDKR